MGCGRPLSATGLDRKGSIGHTAGFSLRGTVAPADAFPNLTCSCLRSHPPSCRLFSAVRGGEKGKICLLSRCLFTSVAMRLPILDLSPLGEIRANKRVGITSRAGFKPSNNYILGITRLFLASNRPTITYGEVNLQGPPLGMRKNRTHIYVWLSQT